MKRNWDTTEERKAFYHTAAWTRVRLLALQRDGYLCQDCLDKVKRGEAFRVNPADTVHHIISLEAAPELGLCLDNLRSICRDCHAKEHPEKGSSKDEQPVRHKMRVIKV